MPSVQFLCKGFKGIDISILVAGQVQSILMLQHPLKSVPGHSYFSGRPVLEISKLLSPTHWPTNTPPASLPDMKMVKLNTQLSFYWKIKYFFPFLCASLLGLSLAHGRTYFYSECTSVCDSQFTHSGAGSGIPGVNSSLMKCWTISCPLRNSAAFESICQRYWSLTAAPDCPDTCTVSCC